MFDDQTIPHLAQLVPARIIGQPLWRVKINFPPICAHEFLMQIRERVRIGLQPFFQGNSPKNPEGWKRVLGQSSRTYECYQMTDLIVGSQANVKTILTAVHDRSDVEVCDPWLDPLILLSRAACARHLEQGRYMFLTEKVSTPRGACLVALTVDGNDGTDFCLSPSMAPEGISFRAGAHFIVRRKILHPHS